MRDLIEIVLAAVLCGFGLGLGLAGGIYLFGMLG